MKPETRFLDDTAERRSRVEEMSVEVTDHRDKLEQLLAQEKSAETPIKLETDGDNVDRDVAELRSKLETTAADVEEQHRKLDELSTQYDKTAVSVEHLQIDVTKIHSEVCCISVLFVCCYIILTYYMHRLISFAAIYL